MVKWGLNLGMCSSVPSMLVSLLFTLCIYPVWNFCARGESSLMNFVEHLRALYTCYVHTTKWSFMDDGLDCTLYFYFCLLLYSPPNCCGLYQPTHRACVEVISASILTEWLCGWVREYKWLRRLWRGGLFSITLLWSSICNIAERPGHCDLILPCWLVQKSEPWYVMWLCAFLHITVVEWVQENCFT
jgi:hypothetical protein